MYEDTLIGIMKLNHIYNMDCQEGLKNLPDKSVNLIVTDPPYFNVMKQTWDGVDVDWDKQWATLDEYREWLKEIMYEFNRVLKDNGSIYVFVDNINGAYVQVDMAEIFTILNRIEWVKTNGLNSKYWEKWRRYTNCNESIIFAEKVPYLAIRNDPNANIPNPDPFKPVKEYMRSERDRLMKDKGMKTFAEFDRFINEVTDTRSVVSRHYFADSQYDFPTRELYAKMQGTGYWLRDYDDLREEYESLRRTFNPARNFTNIWTTPLTTTMEGGTVHPTQKPIKILRRIIETSSNEGDVVLDAFMGSASTAIACIETNRQFIGFEISEEYYNIANERIREERVQTRLL